MNSAPKLRVVSLLVAVMAVSSGSAQDNLVANGSFARDADENGTPDDWSTAGAAGVGQTLTVDAGPEGANAARLVCSKFVGGSSASHAMVCQTGHVAVRAGQWYRLTWRAKARDMQINAVQVALSNTRNWSNTGLQYAFPVGRAWRDYDHVFRSEQDLPAADSRLQFWFASTGTFWLADVTLVPVAGQRYAYHPQIDTEGVKNYVPNSSFECGTAGWGSYNPEMSTWAGNLFRLYGEIDERIAFHGARSLRIQVAKGKAPVFMWDWFDLVEDEVLVPLVAHRGWVPVEEDATFVVSCVLKADRADVPARIMVRTGERNQGKTVRVGTDWQRFSWTFRPRGDFAWMGVGPDLHDTDLEAVTLWVDAIQFEKARVASDYEPRAGVESFLESGVTGNAFYDPDEGVRVRLSAYNNGRSDAEVRGMLRVTDFFDQQVRAEEVTLRVKAGENAARTIDDLVKGRTGFFRVAWSAADPYADPQSLRCMVIAPYDDHDSVFGVNHAYGWPFLLQLARKSGLTWFRDWSVKWHEVEPERGHFDFSGTDPQIDRVLGERLNLDVMFPFPSSGWSTTADMAEIRKVESEKSRHRVLRLACAPNSEDDFRNYVARSVRRYRDRVRHYQVFNEPIYTHYSLPQRLGYGVSDYIRWLNIAADAIRSEREDAVVVGGMGTWAASHWTHEFVRKGGLANVDVFDLHDYPVTADAESFEPDITELAQLMEERGETRPMWLTEYGCYADDDPYRTPQRVGDAAMSRSLWPSEREAAEALVQSAAVFCTHGLRKLFLHAGTCGPINGSDAGNVFFEYGGAPRKMLPAVWAFSRLVDADFEPLDAGPQPSDRRVYLFKVKRGILAIAWTREVNPIRVAIEDGITALDIMGNTITGRAVELTATPVYFLSRTRTPEELKACLTKSLVEKPRDRDTDL